MLNESGLPGTERHHQAVLSQLPVAFSCSVSRSRARGVRHMEEPTVAGCQASGAIKEIDVLWITAGLGCDGDTIAMTAATPPSIEEVVLGALPWTPKVNLHNPFLAAANGDDFLKPFHQAARGEMENFILVVEGSVPNQNNKEEGYGASLGTDAKTGQPITTCEWIDRLAPQAWAVVAAGTCVTYGGIHA